MCVLISDSHCSTSAAPAGSAGTSAGPGNARSMYRQIARDSHNATAPWRATGILPNGWIARTSGVCGGVGINVYGTPFSAQAMRVTQTKLLAGAPMICRSLMDRVLSDSREARESDARRIMESTPIDTILCTKTAAPRWTEPGHRRRLLESEAGWTATV